MEVTHNKILICLLLIKISRNFKVIELPLNIVQLNLYLAKYVFLHNGTQLEGEKCKFQKLQNKDHPISDVCNSLCKYGLHCFVNNALIRPSSLPSQYCWKARVKNSVLTNKYDMWHERIMTDDFLCIFRTLQLSISPCIA